MEGSEHTIEWQTGFDHGKATGAVVSYRQVHEWSPGWTDDQIDRYQNGRDFGVATHKKKTRKS